MRDRGEFSEFFHAIEPRLRQATVATYGPDHGQDACADALLWAYEHWARIQRISRPLPYLFRVAQTRSRRHRRPLAVTPSYDVVGSPNFEPNLAPLVAALPDRQRSAVLLIVGLGWTHAEVADLWGISPSTVATHVARGLGALRHGLGVDSDVS